MEVHPKTSTKRSSMVGQMGCLHLQNGSPRSRYGSSSSMCAPCRGSDQKRRGPDEMITCRLFYPSSAESRTTSRRHPQREEQNENDRVVWSSSRLYPHPVAVHVDHGNACVRNRRDRPVHRRTTETCRAGRQTPHTGRH